MISVLSRNKALSRNNLCSAAETVRSGAELEQNQQRFIVQASIVAARIRSWGRFLDRYNRGDMAFLQRPIVDYEFENRQRLIEAFGDLTDSDSTELLFVNHSDIQGYTTVAGFGGMSSEFLTGDVLAAETVFYLSNNYRSSGGDKLLMFEDFGKEVLGRSCQTPLVSLSQEGQRDRLSLDDVAVDVTGGGLLAIMCRDGILLNALTGESFNPKD